VFITLPAFSLPVFTVTMSSVHRRDFNYDPLRREDIRLLALYPGPPDARLTGKLEHVQLDERIKYEALSYTWGEKESINQLHIGDFSITIKSNLDQALQRLRSKTDIRRLWIDAVCINQRDEVEKAQQIGLMGQIYNFATQVLAWLGEAPDEYVLDEINIMHIGYLAFPMYSDFPEERRKAESSKPSHTQQGVGRPGSGMLVPWWYMNIEETYWEQRIHANLWEWTVLFDKAQLKTKDPFGIVTLLESQWFERMWIVQEIVCAKKLILHIGSQSLQWDLLQRFSFLMRLYELVSYQLSDAVSERLERFVLPIMKIKHFHDHRIQHMDAKRAMDTWMEWLVSAQKRHCTRKHDHIYAFLSLLPAQVKVQIPVDYSMDLSNLYTFVARTALQHGSFRMLHSAGLWRRGLPAHGMDVSLFLDPPTFVPYFDGLGEVEEVGWLQTGYEQDSSEIEYHYLHEYRVDDKHITLKGNFMGIVVRAWSAKPEQVRVLEAGEGLDQYVVIRDGLLDILDSMVNKMISGDSSKCKIDCLTILGATFATSHKRWKEIRNDLEEGLEELANSVNPWGEGSGSWLPFYMTRILGDNGDIHQLCKSGDMAKVKGVDRFLLQQHFRVFGRSIQRLDIFLALDPKMSPWYGVVPRAGRCNQLTTSGRYCHVGFLDQLRVSFLFLPLQDDKDVYALVSPCMLQGFDGGDVPAETRRSFGQRRYFKVA
jgi:hypothetical protein